MLSSCDDVQRGRQDFHRAAVQAQNLAINDYVHGTAEVEINPLDCGARGKRVVNVRAGKEAWKIPKQAEAAERGPAHVLDFSVRWIGMRRHHHFSAGEFTVAKCQEQARAPVPIVRARQTMWERDMFQPREHREHAENITGSAPALESAIGHFACVGCETQVQHIDEIDFAGRVAQTNYITISPALLPKGLDRVLDAARREVAQERVARAEWEESERRTALSLRFGKKSVHDFVRCPVAADGEKISKALRVGPAGQRRGLARTGRLNDFEFDACLANTLERRGCEPAAASASGCRIDDGK